MARWTRPALVVLLGGWGCENDDGAPPPQPASPSPDAPFVDYMRRSKSAEAKVNVNAIFRAASLRLEEVHLTAENGALGMGGAIPPHACPSDGRPEGETGITPPLAVDCSKGPGGKCTPGGGGDGGYDAKLWREGNVWPQLGFELMDPHFFHYNFKWKNDASGGGSCQFTVQAFGDLDGDGTYSTYERSGTALGGEVMPSGELRVENELE